MSTTLKGWVFNDDGTVAPNLTVKCWDQTPTVIGTTTTDANGMWTFTGLTDGVTYDVEVLNNNIVRWIKGGEMHQVANLNLNGNITVTGDWNFTAGQFYVPNGAGLAPTTPVGSLALNTTGNLLSFADGTVNHVVATLDQTQSLTNKTINGLGPTTTGTGNLVGSASPTFSGQPGISDLTNMQHAHDSAAHGGTIAYSSLSGIPTFTTISGYPGATGSGAIVLQNNPIVVNLKQQSGTGYVTTGNDLTNYMFVYGTGTFTLPNPSSAYVGVFRAIKAWGGSVTVNCGVEQISGPGGTSMVSSFTLNNGDSATMWCDGTYWWGL